METILSACISAAVTLAVCLITQHAQSAKDRALLEYKLDELQRRVDKHNSIIERTYKLEEENRVQDEKIKNARDRIDVLERKGD